MGVNALPSRFKLSCLAPVLISATALVLSGCSSLGTGASTEPVGQVDNTLEQSSVVADNSPMLSPGDASASVVETRQAMPMPVTDMSTAQGAPNMNGAVQPQPAEQPMAVQNQMMAQTWVPVYDPVVPLVQNMLAQMELNNMEVNGATPIAVSSFVDLGSLGRTDALGRQLGETFSHELHQNGFTVVEYKATGTIRVTQRGDFALSRNLDELQRSQTVDYVLTGTVNQQYNGLMINARVVNLNTKLIAASAQGFIPAQIVQQMMHQGRMFRAREGMLIRDTTYSLRPISLR